MVVAEAMGMGCPVVVTPEVGMAELVKSGGAGIVIGNEPGKLAAAVMSLLNDEPGRREMGRRGRELVHQQLAWSCVVEQMEEFYRRMLREPAAPRAAAFNRA
jgi:glycosyltransferase involved in cell wall biosynthesis